MNSVVPGGAVSPPAPEADRPQQDWGRPRSGDQPGVAGVWAAALECEARGLLNLIAFATRCAERTADEGEREQWRREVDRARGRLEGLYDAGLPRDFLKEHAEQRRRT